MAVTEPPGDFDYLWEDLGETDEGSELDAYDDDPYESASSLTSNQDKPEPWYRARAATLAIGAIGLAVVAILVSAVLLVSRDPRGGAPKVAPTTATATPASSASSAPPATSSIVATSPPGPPPPPSPSEAAASAPAAPAPRAQQPTKAPEIGVTRTPVTRSPISVRPEPRGPEGRQNYPHY